jgi:hypothetical protein
MYLDNTFLKKILHKDSYEHFLKEKKDNSFVLSKSKHESVMVFYNKNNVIIFDKRIEPYNIYASHDIATVNMII